MIHPVLAGGDPSPWVEWLQRGSIFWSYMLSSLDRVRLDTRLRPGSVPAVHQGARPTRAPASASGEPTANPAPTRNSEQIYNQQALGKVSKSDRLNLSRPLSVGATTGFHSTPRPPASALRIIPYGRPPRTDAKVVVAFVWYAWPIGFAVGSSHSAAAGPTLLRHVCTHGLTPRYCPTVRSHGSGPMVVVPSRIGKRVRCS